METVHRELLSKHRQLFIHSVDTSRIVPSLQNSDILSQADVFEIDCQLSATTRVEKLLDILLTKGGGSFQALCVTLETTYPSLLTAMFLGNTNIRSGNESVSPQVSHLNYGQMNLEHAVDNNNDVQQDNTPQAISNVHYSNNVPSMYNNNTTTANEPVYSTSMPKEVTYTASTPTDATYSTHQQPVHDSDNTNNNQAYVSNRVHTIPDEGGGPYRPQYDQPPTVPPHFTRENSLRTSHRSYDSNRSQGSDGFYSSGASSGSHSIGTAVIRRDVKPDSSPSEKRSHSETTNLRRDQVGRSSSGRRQERMSEVNMYDHSRPGVEDPRDDLDNSYGIYGCKRDQPHRSSSRSCRKVGGSAASDGVITDGDGRYLSSAFSRDQATRKSDRLPLGSSVMPADLDTRYAVLRDQSNSGGPRRPEDKQEILVYHHPVQLKRDDSNRSSSRSSTFSRETASRGSGRSLKDEHQGALKMYDMRGEEPTRGSGRRKQVPAHETTTYRTVEGIIPALSDTIDSAPHTNEQKMVSPSQTQHIYTHNQSADAPPWSDVPPGGSTRSDALPSKQPRPEGSHTGQPRPDGSQRTSSVNRQNSNSKDDNVYNRCAPTRDNAPSGSSKLETSLTDEERSLIDNMSPTGVRLVRSSGANIDAMSGLRTMGRPHKVDKVSRESMAQNSVSIDISRPPQSAVSVDVARTSTETPTRQVAQENHQYSRQPNENSTTTQTVVISELPAQQVLPSDHSVTIPRADERIMVPLARHQLSNLPEPAHHHTSQPGEKVLRHPTRLHSVEENEQTERNTGKAEHMIIPSSTNVYNTTPSTASYTAGPVVLRRDQPSIAEVHHEQPSMTEVGRDQPSMTEGRRDQPNMADGRDQSEIRSHTHENTVGGYKMIMTSASNEKKQGNSNGIKKITNAGSIHGNDRWLQNKCDQFTLELNQLTKQNDLLTKRNEDVMERYRRASSDRDEYKKEYESLKLKVGRTAMESLSLKEINSELTVERDHLMEQIHDIQQQREYDKQEILQLQQQQREVLSESGSSEVINKMYDTALEKCETYKEERDDLKDQQSDMMAQVNATKAKLELLNNENMRLREHNDEIEQRLSTALEEKRNLQLQCTNAIQKAHSANRMNKIIKDSERELSLTLQKTQQKTKQDKDDLIRIRSERNHISIEYHQVMAERKNVHKEIQELNENLNDAEKQLKKYKQDNEILSKGAESLREELNKTLKERDIALKEGDNLSKQLHDSERALSEEKTLDRKPSIESRQYRFSESQSSDLDVKDKRTVDELRDQLSDLLKENKACKHDRDWAIEERKKIVLERESVRTLCDKLRVERDRAVSDSAEALRDKDELKRQISEKNRIIKELSEKYDAVVEDCNLGHTGSCDSAIDTDLQDSYWQTETTQINIDHSSSNEDLGFVLSGGREHQEDALFVSHVTSGSHADGKLRVNDQVLLINNMDVSAFDHQIALQSARGTGTLNMVIKRRKYSHTPQTYNLNLQGYKDVGIEFEPGIYISKINHGSSAAQQHNLAVGDRVVAINNQGIDKHSPSEANALLSNSSTQVSLSVIKTKVSSHSSVISSPHRSITSPTQNTHDNRWNTAGRLKTSSSQTDCLNNHSLSPVDKVSSPITPSGYNELFTSSHGSSSSSTYSRQRAQNTHLQHNNTDYSAEQDVTDSLNAILKEYGPTSNNTSMSNSKSAQKGAGERSKSKGRRRGNKSNPNSTWPKCHPAPAEISPDANLDDDDDEFFVVHVPRKERPQLSNVYPTNNPERSDSVKRKTASTHSEELLSTAQPTSYRATPTFQPEVGSYKATPTFPQEAESYREWHRSSVEYDSTVLPHKSNQDEILSMKRKQTAPQSSRGVRPHSHDASRSHQGSLPPTPRNNSGSSYSSVTHHSNRPYSAPAKRPAKRGPRCVSHDKPSSLDLDIALYSPRPLPHVSKTISPGVPNLQRGRSSDSGSTNSNSVMSNPIFGTHGGSNHGGSTQGSSATPSSDSSMLDILQHQTYKPVSPITVASPQYSNPPGYNQCISSHGIDAASRIPPYYTSPSPSPSQQSSNDDLRTRWRMPSSVSRVSTASSIDDRIFPSPFGSSSSHDFIPPHKPNNSVVAQGGMPYPMSPRNPQPLPNIGETRVIKVEKTSDPLGITIEKGYKDGVFVASVDVDSIAESKGMKVGDQLLEVCGINMRNATYDFAAKILSNMSDSINILIQYNPDKTCSTATSSADHSGTDDDDSLCSDEGSSICMTSTNNTPQQRRLKRERNRHSSRTITPESQQISPLHRHSSSTDSKHFVLIKKSSPTAPLGIALVGGNSVGIFIKEVRPGSLAEEHSLRVGEQIIEFNGVDLSEATTEQATQEIGKPIENVTMRLQYDIEKYYTIKDIHCDSLYVRMLCDYEAINDGELTLRKQAVYFVDNTQYNGAGTWRAWELNDNGMKTRYGAIPSKTKMEETLLSRHSLSDITPEDDLKSSSRRSSNSAVRRSFFRRKRHQRNNSKDSREFNSYSDVSINSDSLSYLDGGSLMAYQRVKRLDSSVCRPVLLLGPLAEQLINRICSDSPDKYTRCEPEIVHASISSLEAGQDNGVFIDYEQCEKHYMCTTVQAIKKIIEQGHHCMLKLHPRAIERLHKNGIYPIVVFIRHKNSKEIREVKDTRFLPDKISNKVAKELFERFRHYEAEFKSVICETVAGGNLAFMSMKIKAAIDNQQNKTIWIPSGQL